MRPAHGSGGINTAPVTLWGCHPGDQQWLTQQAECLPRHFLPFIAKRYRVAPDRRTANLGVLGLVEQSDQLPLTAAADDNDICDYAKACAARCRRMALRSAKGILEIKRYLAELGIPEPDTEDDKGFLPRVTSEHWWRRRLRVCHGRGVEVMARDLGMVHRYGQPYVSTTSVNRRRSQKRRNRRIMEQMIATNELGDQYSLAELSDISVSNPKIRRGELMVRVSGFEQLAKECGHIGVFYTLTCPSRMHAMHHHGERNTRYDGTTPRDAQTYLNRQWRRVRAALKRKGITVYGLRVVEPHHDETPHWHLLLFMAPRHARSVTEIMRHYALQVDGDEPGASERRLTVERIDPKKGSAAGYVAKYISKNIDGHGLDAGEFGEDPVHAADRVEAWASTWGVRQFQQVGGPSVSVWRELRRIHYELDGWLEEARQAADRGDWCAYIKAMGGVDCPRRVAPVQLAYREDVEGRPTEPALNVYGEPVDGGIIGIRCGEVVHITRYHDWTFERSYEDHWDISGLVAEKLCDRSATSHDGCATCATLEETESSYISDTLRNGALPSRTQSHDGFWGYLEFCQ